MEWKADFEFTLEGTTFRACPWAKFESSPMHFLLAKERGLVDYYADLVSELAPRNILELGIYQGGSAAFFASLAKPRKLVAIDLDDHPAAPLREFIAQKQLENVVQTHYGVDQADSARLRSIVDAEFGVDQIDLVVDDASHRLGPSRLAFNALFPYVRPGGTYIIEDWALLHVGIPWGDPGELPLSVLGFELLMAAGSRGGVIESVEINQYVIAVKRGPAALDPATFEIGRCYNDDSRELVPGS